MKDLAVMFRVPKYRCGNLFSSQMLHFLNPINLCGVQRLTHPFGTTDLVKHEDDVWILVDL